MWLTSFRQPLQLLLRRCLAVQPPADVLDLRLHVAVDGCGSRFGTDFLAVRVDEASAHRAERCRAESSAAVGGDSSIGWFCSSRRPCIAAVTCSAVHHSGSSSSSSHTHTLYQPPRPRKHPSPHSVRHPPRPSQLPPPTTLLLQPLHLLVGDSRSEVAGHPHDPSLVGDGRGAARLPDIAHESTSNGAQLLLALSKQRHLHGDGGGGGRVAL